jgi:hypothetical protein
MPPRPTKFTALLIRYPTKSKALLMPLTPPKFQAPLIRYPTKFKALMIPYISPNQSSVDAPRSTKFQSSVDPLIPPKVKALDPLAPPNSKYSVDAPYPTKSQSSVDVIGLVFISRFIDLLSLALSIHNKEGVQLTWIVTTTQGCPVPGGLDLARTSRPLVQEIRVETKCLIVRVIY